MARGGSRPAPQGAHLLAHEAAGKALHEESCVGRADVHSAGPVRHMQLDCMPFIIHAKHLQNGWGLPCVGSPPEPPGGLPCTYADMQRGVPFEEPFHLSGGRCRGCRRDHLHWTICIAQGAPGPEFQACAAVSAYKSGTGARRVSFGVGGVVARSFTGGGPHTCQAPAKPGLGQLQPA